jgi:hypothetical protein
MLPLLVVDYLQTLQEFGCVMDTAVELREWFCFLGAATRGRFDS